MKRMLVGILTGVLLLVWAMPGAAAKDSGFSDVARDAPYASAVDLCHARGVLLGSGTGQFRPDDLVTHEELMVASARLHNIMLGGTGVLSAPPAGYLTATITRQDGTAAGFDRRDIERGSFYGVDAPSRSVWFEPPFDNQSDVQEGDRFTVTINNGVPRVFQAQARAKAVDGRIAIFMSLPQAGVTDVSNLYELFRYCDSRDFEPAWAEDAFYYLTARGLYEPFSFGFSEVPARRDEIAEILCRVVPESALQPALRPVTEVPDVSAPAGAQTEAARLLSFYSAGIWSGEDAYGTFCGWKGMTRAALAETIARILEPSMRTAVPLKTPDWYPDYTLEALPAALTDRLDEQALLEDFVLPYGDRLCVYDTSKSAMAYYNAQGEPISPAAADPITGYFAQHQKHMYEGPRAESERDTKQDARDLGYSFWLSTPYVDGCAAASPYGALAGCGYFSEDGKMLIPPRFSYAGALVGGKAMVRTPDGGWWLLTVT